MPSFLINTCYVQVPDLDPVGPELELKKKLNIQLTEFSFSLTGFNRMLTGPQVCQQGFFFLSFKPGVSNPWPAGNFWPINHPILRPLSQTHSIYVCYEQLNYIHSKSCVASVTRTKRSLSLPLTAFQQEKHSIVLKNLLSLIADIQVEILPGDYYNYAVMMQMQRPALL